MADSVASYRARVLASVAARPSLPPVAVPVADAVGRVTATEVVAQLAVPRFDNAAMDGYAVRAADVAAAPVSLPVVGVVAAGDAGPDRLPSGVALRIMTGAPMPAGADTVIPFEWTDRGSETVRVEQGAGAGRHVRRAGEDVETGAEVAPAGTLLRPPHLGLLAATGCREVVVRPRPRVAVLATGAELAGPLPQAFPSSSGPRYDDSAWGDDLPAGHVPDSNSVTIAAAVRAAGGVPTVWGPAPDHADAFLGLLTAAAAAADLVVTTGGISAGDHDVVKAALHGLDGMWFGSVAVKPGRPQGAGMVRTEDGREVPLVCVPGTPVAAYTSFLLFAVPALCALAGAATSDDSVESRPLAARLEPSPDRTLVLPGRLDGVGRVAVLQGHAGHSQRLLAEADVLLVVPPGEPMAAGEAVEVLRPGERLHRF